MHIILLVLCAFAWTNAIRVPSKWPDGDVKHSVVPIGQYKYYDKVRAHNLDKLDITPYKLKHKKYTFTDEKPKSFLKLSAAKKRSPSKHKRQFRPNPWVPIAPFSINTKLGYMKPEPNITFDLRQVPRDYYFPRARTSQYLMNQYSPVHRNYRDDRTYENRKEEEYLTESTPVIENLSEDEITSDHEEPMDIPTAPIYPGEGKWAKRGKKYRPFISKHKFSDLKEDSEERPDGYETFENGEKLFAKKKTKYDNNSKQPIRESYIKHTTSHKPLDGEESRNEEDVNEFVPMTLYSQVRKTENEEHLPPDSDDSEGGRLKEVIKDSKISTVYTEEGYEDSSYDHAGHEKEAEDAQGYREYNKEEENEKPKEKSLKIRTKDQGTDESRKIIKNTELLEPEVSATNFETLKRKKHPKKSRNNFMKSKATKTMELKESSNGEQMEITSEVKVMMGPNGENKTEKVIEIMPKIIKYLTTSTPDYTVINSTNSVSLTEEFSPETTSATESSRFSRAKRYTNDFPKINVQADFTDGIEQSGIPEYKQNVEENKYPYYRAKYINKNSPLRYSENMNNIPKKTEGKMSFYEQANEIECPEVDSDIEAIPKRIQEVEEAANTGEKLEEGDEEEKSPRLGKLGQRIDCFKRKYFGENPLDSPFFEEKEIEPVLPLFKVFQEKTAGFQISNPNSRKLGNIGGLRSKKYHSKFSLQNIKDNIREDPELATNEKIRHLISNTEKEDLEHKVLVIDDSSSEIKYQKSNSDTQINRGISSTVDIIKVDNFKSIDQITTEAPPVSLITTPDYSVDVTPKHIYDQIELLEFLPSQTTDSSITNSELESLRQAKFVEEGSDETVRAAQLQFKQNPNSQQNMIKRRQRLKPKRTQQTFDINSYLVKQSARTGAVTPSNYNGQIMPLEQLNVFSDVLNNIKNGTNDPLRAAPSSYQKPSQINSFHNSGIRIKVPPKKIHIRTSDLTKYLNERNLFFMTSTTSSTVAPSTRSTTQIPRRGMVKYASTTEKYLYDDEYSDIDEDHIYGTKNVSGKKSTIVQPENDSGEEQAEEDEEDEDSEFSETHTTETLHKPSKPVDKSTEILGLVPPSKWLYRTIYQPVKESQNEPEVSASDVINTYYVVGMKPPSNIQKVFDYSNFQKLTGGKSVNRFQKVNYRRGKRSPNRRSYFEVVRSQNSEDSMTVQKDDDDDYVPHRPKNWHWDETLKKIIYDNPKKLEDDDEDADDDSENIETELKEPISKNIQQTTTRRTFTTTTPINGPSYVDFVNILKSNKNYVSIPDPTTTKKGIKIEVTESTTVNALPTKPPEFLGIISKLRQSDTYMLIPEKNKTKTTTTTEEPDEADDDVDETQTSVTDIKNSPGRGAVDIGQNFKIFDINDFLPRVKTYTPKTSIDYSKYKTIQRNPLRSSTTELPEVGEAHIEIVRPITILTTEEPSATSLQSTSEGKLEIIELSRKRGTTQPTTTTTPTTTKPFRTRGRRTTTTSKPAIESVASNSRHDSVFISASKPRRVYPKRRPTHIKTRTTTESQGESASLQDFEKIVRRRHNADESTERIPKIISLESIIMLDQMKAANLNNLTRISDKTSSNISLHSNQSIDSSVDDVLKNINQLKEINIDETDYTAEARSSEENVEEKDEYFDDDTKISLEDGEATNRKLIISKDRDQDMFYYASV